MTAIVMETTFLFNPSKNVGVEKLQCVECKKPLKLLSSEKLSCPNKHVYKIVNNVPILLSNASKNLIQQSTTSSSGTVMKDEYELSKKSKVKQFIKRWTNVPNIHIPMVDEDRLFDIVTYQGNPNKFVLSIGGGPGRDRPSIVNLNIDAYPHVEIVGDAHNLPFKAESVDGVVINAVFEHLERPDVAAQEVYRVLKKGGIVFAETPFLQHYHGYPFHFQNYTVTGHMYLFRKMKILQSGAVTGPFSTVATMLVNLPEDLIVNKYIRKIVMYIMGILVYPMRLLDVFFRDHPNGFRLTSGTYVLAKKEK